MADAEEEENGYVSIGSAFKQLETDDDVQREKNRKDKDHYVLDKQGRRRFHGAFTGGFSAGYYNTVGSKEGWSPSPFMSSRDSKASQLNQRPEDYMDDEDLDTFGIAPREIAARDQFLQGTAGGKRPHSTHSSVIPGEAPLQNLIVPARSSVGARLLKAMGWREGQGVGPKIMKYSAKKEEGKKIYGCALPNQADEEYVDDAVRGFMFAPHDVAPWQFVAKDDHHGIGYQGMEHQPVLQESGVSQSIYGMSGKAFGVGALEEDDEDIYSRENIVNFSVTEASEADLNAEQVFGWTGGMQGDWSLKCFSKTSKPDSHKKVYPPPLVPRDFVPLHKFLASSSAHNTGSSSSSLSSSKRAQLLSESKTSADVHSVFDLMSPEDRDRLKRATDSAKSTSSTTAKEGRSHKADRGRRWDQRPGSSVAAAITTGTYMPFANDPQKQERYQAYLQGHRKFFGREYDRLTEWEKQKELEQFSRSSNLYQPLASTLADKFTHAKTEEEEKNEPMDINDAEQAAEAGMFGVLTRDVQKWHPHRVLCKRFNIPDPYPDSALVGVPCSNSSNRSLDERGRQTLAFELSTIEKPTISSIPAVTDEPAKAERTERKIDAGFATVDHRREVDEPKPKEDDPESEVEETEKERPPMEMFRSIFADSSSESEQDDDPPEQNPSSSDIAVMGTEPVQTADTTDRPKQQWQNFALLTSLPPQPPVAAASFLTPTQEEKQAQSDNSTKNPVASETPRSSLSSDSLFGPPLPPPAADSECEDGSSDGESNSHSSYSRSKHTRPKSHHKHKHKKDKRKHHKSRHRQ